MMGNNTLATMLADLQVWGHLVELQVVRIVYGIVTTEPSVITTALLAVTSALGVRGVLRRRDRRTFSRPVRRRSTPVRHARVAIG